MTNPTTRHTAVSIAESAIRATLGGTLEDLAKLVHPEATNRESISEPPSSRGTGPRASHATGEWLREAFSDLTWTTERSMTEGDIVVTYGQMSGTHTGNFTVWTPDAQVERVLVPTGRTSASVRPTSSGSSMVSSSSTEPSATTRAWPPRPAGSHPPPAFSSAAPWPRGTSAGPPTDRSPAEPDTTRRPTPGNTLARASTHDRPPDSPVLLPRHRAGLIDRPRPGPRR